MALKKQDKTLKIIPRAPQSKLANLKARPYLLTDPEELVHLDWFRDWRP
jgi:hypothetical protein